jgi:rhodanese-related sulfurtransferase
MQLGERYADLPAGAQTLVVCRSGNRSAHATAFLLQQGIEAVNLDGGLLAWERAGRPLVTDDGTPPAVL